MQEYGKFGKFERKSFRDLLDGPVKLKAGTIITDKRGRKYIIHKDGSRRRLDTIE